MYNCNICKNKAEYELFKRTYTFHDGTSKVNIFGKCFCPKKYNYVEWNKFKEIFQIYSITTIVELFCRKHAPFNATKIN